MTGAETNQDQNAQDQNSWNRWQTWSLEHSRLSFFIAVLTILFIIILAAIIFWALFPSMAPSWTGFAETVHPLYTGRSPAKTLWDWLGLLIIPLILGAGATWIGHAQQNREMRAHAFEQKQAEENRKNDWAIEMDRQEQALVDQYFERMTQYLLHYELRSSSADDEIRTIARASTLGVLRNINALRKGQIIQFLYETRLITTPDPIIDLEGANLQEMALDSADLRKAHLAGTDMHGAHLDHANLSGANLSSCNLIDSRLREADLSQVNAANAFFSGAHMRGTVLQSAVLTNVLLNNAGLVEGDLRRADLQGANLVGADLSQARLEGTNFAGAKFKPGRTSPDDGDGKTPLVDGATYDAETVWPEDFDPAAQGTIPGT
jgi:uncharacterized protein YjbI with pentapeptide repeats